MIDPSFESELFWRGTPIHIAPFDGTVDRATLQKSLVSLIARAERAGILSDGNDLARTCDDEISRRLTSLMWKRARDLERTGRLKSKLPDDVMMLGRALPSSAIVEVLASVIANGFVYDQQHARGSWSGRLGLYARRVWELMGNIPLKLTARALRPRASNAVCLDYATAMHVLFFALKRATGFPANTFVIGIAGDAFGVNDRSHAWNWFVDVEQGRIIAFDVSSKGMRQHPFDLTIDPSRYRNVSAFLTTIIFGATRPVGALWEPHEAAELLTACIDPETDRGQVLLFHIAEHPMTPLGVRARLARHLAARDFARAVPRWRERLDRRTAQLGRAGRLVSSSGDWELLPFSVRCSTTTMTRASPLHSLALFVDHVCFHSVLTPCPTRRACGDIVGCDAWSKRRYAQRVPPRGL